MAALDKFKEELQKKQELEAKNSIAAQKRKDLEFEQKLNNLGKNMGKGGAPEQKVKGKDSKMSSKMGAGSTGEDGAPGAGRGRGRGGPRDRSQGGMGRGRGRGRPGGPSEGTEPTTPITIRGNQS